jgi:1-pyrroline-5-carboxylate dehydrogenase
MATLATSVRPFTNQLPVDFRQEDNAIAMRAAIAKVRGELGREYDLVIGGRRVRTDEKIRSLNPAHPDQIVGVHQKAVREHVELAMAGALHAFESWKNVAAGERAELLFRVAEILRRHKFEFNAWMVVEVGKNWAEAEADTCEAIDFCELYGRLALRLAEAEPLVQLPGERDWLRYIPLGAGAVIAPWNFPLAILCGMTVASIVCGNTVVMKPSSDSPTVAAKFFEALEEAGLPAGVVNFCPGSGATFGHGLVEHPQTRFIAFTGSREVGLDIHLRAAKAQPGQIWIKRTILEMGGKDAIIVDAEADLDAAAEGVTASAFGFQGQKCSACSRAIVVSEVYDRFIEKLKRRTETSIKIGSVEQVDVNFGPVVSQKAFKSILDYIEVGKREGRLVTGGAPAGNTGYFIQPTIIADVDPNARIAQEEIFGPVLAVIRAKDFDDALNIANGTQYGLTGAVYSNREERLQKASATFHVGNLYLNRKCTGALVGVQPFGGFNMSGTDSKAGGRDYLLLFTQAKVVSRRLRH